MQRLLLLLLWQINYIILVSGYYNCFFGFDSSNCEQLILKLSIKNQGLMLYKYT